MEENYKRILTSDRVLTNEELTDLGVTSINEDRYLFDDALYNVRVAAAGGTIPYPDNVQEFFRDLPTDIDTDTIQLLFMADGGATVRTDGLLKYYRNAYDLFKTKDLDGSATAANQPRMVSGIAPNSKIAASRQGGIAPNTNLDTTRKFTHPSITVTGTFTLVKVLNSELVGKTQVTYEEVTTGSLTEIVWTGNLYAYIIYAGVITAGQRTALSAFLLGKYPEIESVQIGTQVWSVRNFEGTRTALGVDIPNVTANADWANATVLYNNAITGGATEREALIEAAMWCYYNNNAANGAIYGKLFNRYAKKLFKADLLSANFGWHIGTETEYQLIDDSAFDLMFEGTDYWTTDNGTNETGFTALGGGYRNADGTFADTKVATKFWVGDADKSVQLTDNSDTVVIDTEDVLEGCYIRLVNE